MPPTAGAPTIGLVGRITEWKGQHIFIEAASLVRSKFPQARFQIIGSAMFGEEVYEAKLRAMVVDHELENCVEFMGFRSDVQALANVSLTRGRAKFSGKSARKGLLPEVAGLNPAKVPSQEIDAAWRDDTQRWLHALQVLAADYLSGAAPVQPGSACRTCQLTVLCRRVELATVDVEEAP